MLTVSAVAAVIGVGGLFIHALSIALAAPRCARRRRPAPLPHQAPAVAIVQPLCGVEAFSRETLQSVFALDYPDYEVIFCVADAADPIVPLARAAMAAHPKAPARLLIGDDRVSANPKLNNVVKGWKAAKREWIVIADSNVLMPPDYIQRLLRRARPKTGVVCAPPIGSRPESFAAEVECAFLNTYEARWQYAAEALGMGYAQGKSMLWRRDTLEAGGGIEALGKEIAEDAASTKLVRKAGLQAHLVSGPFLQPLGRRKLKDVWGRQLRWARLRRATFPLQFAPEILTTSLLPILAAALAAPYFGWSPLAGAALAGLIWYGAEAALAALAGWPLGWASPLAWLGRDLLLPPLWAAAWTGDTFTWRGNAMSVDERDLEAKAAPSDRRS